MVVGKLGEVARTAPWNSWGVFQKVRLATRLMNVSLQETGMNTAEMK